MHNSWQNLILAILAQKEFVLGNVKHYNMIMGALSLSKFPASREISLLRRNISPELLLLKTPLHKNISFIVYDTSWTSRIVLVSRIALDLNPSLS